MNMYSDETGPPVEAAEAGPHRTRRTRQAGIAAATAVALLAAGGVLAANASASTAGHLRSAASTGAYVAPYVDMSNSQESVLNTVIQSDGLRGFTAAFVIGVGCDQEWGDTLPVGSDPTIGGEISSATAAGASVIISSGGADGEPLSFTCSDQATIDAGYRALLSDYPASSLDFDIEGAAIADTTGIDQTLQAMKDIGASFSVTLPVLPSGLTDYGVDLIQDAANMGVTIPTVNLMTMDYYEGDIEMGQAAISAAEATLAQMRAINSSYSYANIGITPMIGTNDDGSTFTLADASTVASWAAQNGVGRLSFWSVDRDQDCSSASVRAAIVHPDASSTCSGVSQSTGAFTAAFLSSGSGSNPPPPTTPPASASPTQTGGGSGTCAPAWNSATTYYDGTQVSYDGSNYTAIYVSTGVQPGSAIAWDIWTDNGPC
jgi:chitinase